MLYPFDNLERNVKIIIDVLLYLAFWNCQTLDLDFGLGNDRLWTERPLLDCIENQPTLRSFMLRSEAVVAPGYSAVQWRRFVA